MRYRAKTPDASEGTFRDTIPTKLATAVWNLVSKYKSIPNFPQTETCELLILDRSVDQVYQNLSFDILFSLVCHA